MPNLNASNATNATKTKEIQKNSLIYQTCGLYRSYGSLKTNVDYQLYNLNQYSYCSQLGNGSNFTSSYNAVFFIPNNQLDCSFRSIVNNLLSDDASLAIIGTNGPIVSWHALLSFDIYNHMFVFFKIKKKKNFSTVDSQNQIGIVFIPQSVGLDLEVRSL